MRLITALLLTLTLLLTGCGPKTPEQELKGTITEMKALVEQRNIRELMYSYTHPDDLQEIGAERLESMLEWIEKDERYEDNTRELYQMLIRAEMLVPRFENDNTVAVFLFGDENLPGEARFEKVEGRWRLMNDRKN